VNRWNDERTRAIVKKKGKVSETEGERDGEGEMR
jgi:hypothetical protein